MGEIKLYTSAKFKNWLVTIAIGEEYLNRFETYILPLVSKYAEINGLGLACVVEDIDKEYSEKIRNKKKTWQKFLVPYALSKLVESAVNICYFDSDILFNPYGKNLFEYHDESQISLVSQIYDLPGDEQIAKKIISFSRNKFYSDLYPLDSAIFMSTKQYYEFNGYKPFDDICCAGLYIANINNHEKGLRKIFCKYENTVDSITEGGDEPAFNFEIRSSFKTQNIPYEFQAIWNYEMAWKYRHLYKKKLFIDEAVIDSICSCLMGVTALHFAGSWYESQLCYDQRIIKRMLSEEVGEYFIYEKLKSNATPAGRIIPPNNIS